MLSTESWDNCEKPPLLFPFTALTCDETPVFSGSVLNLVAHSVDKIRHWLIFRQPVNERCDLGHELLFFITKITCNALTDNEYFKMSISGLFRMLRVFP